MIKIGECVTFRTWKAFLDETTTRQGREYLIHSLNRLIEPKGLILIEVLRVSKQKWQVIEVCTEENNYILEDDDLFLKADFYNTKSLLNAKPVKWYNALLGEQVENRVASEANS